MRDLRQVYELAGKVPPREIRRQLRLSKRQLYYACELLRAQGKSVSLRFHHSNLEYCPSCGCMRSTLGDHGICEPCRKARQLDEIQSRATLIFEQLPAEDRALYADTEAELSSKADPMPRPRPMAGLSAYERAKASDEYDLAMEQWSIRNLSRQVKAAQKRKERMERKLKERKGK